MHNPQASHKSSVPGAVHILGAGGIGCAVGYALRAGNLPVTFVAADQEKVSWGNQYGVGLDQGSLLAAPFIDFETWQPAVFLLSLSVQPSPWARVTGAEALPRV